MKKITTIMATCGFALMAVSTVQATDYICSLGSVFDEPIATLIKDEKCRWGETKTLTWRGCNPNDYNTIPTGDHYQGCNYYIILNKTKTKVKFKGLTNIFMAAVGYEGAFYYERDWLGNQVGEKKPYGFGMMGVYDNDDDHYIAPTHKFTLSGGECCYFYHKGNVWRAKCETGKGLLGACTMHMR